MGRVSFSVCSFVHSILQGLGVLGVRTGLIMNVRTLLPIVLGLVSA